MEKVIQEDPDEVQLTKLETIFVVGIIGCMLFATWELAHLIVDEWFRDWVKVDVFTRQRIIYYGIAFTMAISSVIVTTRFAFTFGQFGKTINRAFLWYGTLLLISTIAIFVFDCLPEVIAGFIGAGVFIFAIYFLQKKYFTKERIIKDRLEKGKCFSCGTTLRLNATHCTTCGIKVGRKCSECNSFVKLMDKYCSSCGVQQKNNNTV